MFRRLFPKGSLRLLVAKNTGSQLVGRVVSTIMMAIVSLLIARQYGAAGYGDFVKITTYVGLFYLFADFGLNAVYIQNTAREKDEGAARIWQNLFGLRLVMSAVLITVAVVLLYLFPRGSDQGYTPLVRTGIMFLIPAILAQTATTTTNALFQRLLRYDLATVAQNVGSVVMLVTALLLARVPSVNGAYLGIWSVMCGSIATSLLAIYLVHKQNVPVLPLFHVKDMKREFMKALPLGLTLIFNLVYFHSDSVILTLTRSTEEVGIYGLAYKVFEFPLVFPLFYMNAVYPMLIKTGVLRANTSEGLFWKSLWFLLVVSMVTVAGIWIGAPTLALIRSEFAASVTSLRVLTLGLPVFFASSLFMWMLIAQNRKWLLFVIHSFAMVVNIGLNYFFIPRYGYMAAAWITTVSELLVLFSTGYFVLHSMQKIRLRMPAVN